MQAVIQAGGRGTRLSPVTRDQIPKPMVRIGGKPLLQWQIERLKENGIRDMIVIIGHLGEKIKEFFGDGGGLEVRLSYLEEKTPLGTGGALYGLKEILDGDYFVLVWGDIFFDLDLSRIARFHCEKKSAVTLFVHPNDHPFDSDLVCLNQDGRVTGIDVKGNDRSGGWYQNCVNAGFFIVNREVCGRVRRPEKIDFEREILLPLIEEGNVYGYRSPEYMKDIGTEQRLLQAEKALKSGLVFSRNLRQKQRCVFLDRDGTLNRYRGFIGRAEEFELEACAREAVARLNHSPYLAICVTNQPVVARGLCGVEEVEKIHRKMAVLLGEGGAFLDDVAFCPHHPDRGYEGENPLYKMKCDCRKPETGMIDRFVKKYNIDVRNSWMVGDTTVDIQTGINAGMRTALLLTGEGGGDQRYSAVPDLICRDLSEAAARILERDWTYDPDKGSEK